MTRAVELETLTCGRCGSDWQRRRCRGSKPRLCPQCKTQAPPAGEHLAPVNRVDPLSPAYRVAFAAVQYRLALEQLGPLLRMCACGCPMQMAALELLDQVEAPARNGRRSRPGSTGVGDGAR